MSVMLQKLSTFVLLFSCLSANYIPPGVKDQYFCDLKCAEGLDQYRENIGCKCEKKSKENIVIEPDHEFRRVVLKTFNMIRDSVALGKVENFSSATYMQELEYDIYLEYLSMCKVKFDLYNYDNELCARSKDYYALEYFVAGPWDLPENLDLSRMTDIEKLLQEWFDATQKTYVIKILLNSRSWKVGCTRVMTGKTHNLGCYFGLLYLIVADHTSPNAVMYNNGTPCSDCPWTSNCSETYKGLCKSHYFWEGVKLYPEDFRSARFLGHRDSSELCSFNCFFLFLLYFAILGLK